MRKALILSSLCSSCLHFFILSFLFFFFFVSFFCSTSYVRRMPRKGLLFFTIPNSPLTHHTHTHTKPIFLFCSYFLQRHLGSRLAESVFNAVDVPLPCRQCEDGERVRHRCRVGGGGVKMAMWSFLLLLRTVFYASSPRCVSLANYCLFVLSLSHSTTHTHCSRTQEFYEHILLHARTHSHTRMHAGERSDR